MTRAARVSSLSFSAVAAGILGAALLVTQLVAGGAPHNLRLLFRPLCHTIESRCFHLGGVPMPICARCTGLYAGFLVGIGLFAALRKLRESAIPNWLVIALVLPLVADGITQALGLRTSGNELRFLTGLLAGSAGLAWVMNRIELSARTMEIQHKSVEHEA